MALNDEIRTQKNSGLRKRVFRAIQSMYKLFKGSPLDIQIVDKYLNVWKPLSGDVEDVIQFPYTSKKHPLAEKKNARHCLFALVNDMILSWHKHCKSDDLSPTQQKKCVDMLEVLLSKIELVIKHQLDLPVQGSDETGYEFKLPKEE